MFTQGIGLMEASHLDVRLRTTYPSVFYHVCLAMSILAPLDISRHLCLASGKLHSLTIRQTLVAQARYHHSLSFFVHSH